MKNSLSSGSFISKPTDFCDLDRGRVAVGNHHLKPVDVLDLEKIVDKQLHSFGRDTLISVLWIEDDKSDFVTVEVIHRSEVGDVTQNHIRLIND